MVASSLGVGLVFSLLKPGFSIAQRFFPGGYDFFFFSLVSFALFSGIFLFSFGGMGGIGKLIDQVRLVLPGVFVRNLRSVRGRRMVTWSVFGLWRRPQ